MLSLEWWVVGGWGLDQKFRTSVKNIFEGVVGVRAPPNLLQ